MLNLIPLTLLVTLFLVSSNAQQTTPIATFQGFTLIKDVGVDTSGNVYVSDSGSGHITKFNAAGVQQQTFSITSVPAFTPHGVDIDASGNIYIADIRNKVIKLDSSGVQQQVFTTSSGASGPFAVNVDAFGNVYVGYVGNGGQVVKFNAAGVQQQVFTTSPALSPYGVDVDTFGNVYVADVGNDRVVKFDSSGVQQLTFSAGRTIGIDVDSSGNIYVGNEGSISKRNAAGVFQQSFIANPGSLSSANGFFGGAVDASGNVYIADRDNYRVVKLNSAGVQQQVFVSTTPVLSRAYDISVDASGNMYVPDYAKGRAVKLDSTGALQQTFTTTSPGLSNIFGIQVDTSGNVYVLDSGNRRVVKFNPGGVQQQIFTSVSLNSFPEDLTVDFLGNVYIVDTGNNQIIKLNAAGVQQQIFTTTSPALVNPYSIDVDASGNIYIADKGNSRVVKLNAAGVQQLTFDTSAPSGIDVDSSGNIYVVGGGNVVKYNSAGVQQEIFSTTGSYLNSFNPVRVDVDASGNLYVADPFGSDVGRIVVFGASSSIVGDPQFIGFQGQHFQFHGIPDEHFNLISTPNFFVNSHFIYLATGTTEVYNDTEPFSHPGTYIDRLSFILNGIEIELYAGSHSQGFSLITLNKKPLPSGKHISLSLPNSHISVHDHTSVTIRIDPVTITITNSDHFFNLNARLNDVILKNTGAKHVLVSGLTREAVHSKISNAYPKTRFSMHGLLGQTWRNIEYTDKLLYEGDTNDYLVDDLFSPDFTYSLYKDKI